MREYDHSKLLIIDPVLEFSTFLGGTGADRSYDIALDGNGDIYITGCVKSPDYPVAEGAYDDTYNGDFDVFITKLAANGSTLLYSTFLGGTDDETGYSIVVDSNGDSYITGSTRSTNFPTTSGVYDVTLSAGTDVIVSKLAANGSTLIHSTYIGNTGLEEAKSIGIDSNKDVYITGYTQSEFYPIKAGAYDDTLDGTRDAFVTKLNSDFSNLIYSTFIGGSDGEVANSIFVDEVGDAYITGYTIDGATDYPTTPGAYDQTHNGLQDIFVSKLAVNGSTLIFSTFLGGSYSDYARSIAVDGNGDLYVAGETNSNNFPSTTGAYDEIGPVLFGENKAFISKFSSDGTTLLNSTFLGGIQRDAVRSLALDDNGDIFVTGITNSPEFPITPGAYDESLDAYSDIFVTKLSANLSTLLFSTFLGGQDIDSSYSIASASDGIVYITGQYLGDVGDFPITEGAFQESFGGLHDIFVTKLKLTPYAPSNIISMTESNENGKYIMLFWNAVECASATISYNVFRGTTSGNYSLLGSVPGSQSYFNDTSVIEDQPYYYVITATNYIGESEYSSEHYTTIASVSTVSNPSAPLNFMASAGEEFIHLSWDAPIDDGGSPIVRFNLYRGESPSDYNTVFFVIGTEFNDTSVIGGTTYYYVVGAVNEDGGRMYTDEISATPSTGISSGEITTTVISTTTQISTTTVDNSKAYGSQIVFTLLAFTAVVGTRIIKRKMRIKQ
jgi:fibronectin type 3 domain-containing protein